MHWLRIDGRVPCGFSVSFCFRVRFGRRAWRIGTIREGLKSTPNNTRRIYEGLSRCDEPHAPIRTRGRSSAAEKSGSDSKILGARGQRWLEMM